MTIEKNGYILQSHNSWSYIRPKKWWLRPFKFMAKCQKANIYDQYVKYGVRSYDLRVKFDKNGNVVIAHGLFDFDIDRDELMRHLSFMNDNKCVVRILHEVRREKEYTEESIERFKAFCKEIEEKFKDITFYCGRNLYNWMVDYEFDYNPSEEGVYSSVQPPKWIDDWFPWIYARLHNKETFKMGTDKDILAVDFVNIR